MTEKRNTRAAVAASITVILWASAFVSIRDAGRNLDAGPLTLGRSACAAAVLLLFWALRREGLPDRRAWPGIVTGGVLWFGLYMICLNWGEQLVDAGTAALLVNIGPILMALLGGWLLKEGFAPRLFLGIAVSFGGVALVSLSTGQDASVSMLGVVLCVIAAVSYAIGVVTQKPTLRYASPLQYTAFGCLIATVLCLPFAPAMATQLSQAPTSTALHMVYLGVFPSALAFLTWGYALSQSTAGKMGATTYVVPALVVLMSWAFLSEVPGWLTLAGGVLCLLGVAVSRSKGRPKNRSGAAIDESPLPAEPDAPATRP